MPRTSSSELPKRKNPLRIHCPQGNSYSVVLHSCQNFFVIMPSPKKIEDVPDGCRWEFALNNRNFIPSPVEEKDDENIIHFYAKYDYTALENNGQVFLGNLIIRLVDKDGFKVEKESEPRVLCLYLGCPNADTITFINPVDDLAKVRLDQTIKICCFEPYDYTKEDLTEENFSIVGKTIWHSLSEPEDCGVKPPSSVLLYKAPSEFYLKINPFLQEIYKKDVVNETCSLVIGKFASFNYSFDETKAESILRSTDNGKNFFRLSIFGGGGKQGVSCRSARIIPIPPKKTEKKSQGQNKVIRDNFTTVKTKSGTVVSYYTFARKYDVKEKILLNPVVLEIADFTDTSKDFNVFLAPPKSIDTDSVEGGWTFEILKEKNELDSKLRVQSAGSFWKEVGEDRKKVEEFHITHDVFYQESRFLGRVVFKPKDKKYENYTRTISCWYSPTINSKSPLFKPDDNTVTPAWRMSRGLGPDYPPPLPKEPPKIPRYETLTFKLYGSSLEEGSDGVLLNEVDATLPLKVKKKETGFVKTIYPSSNQITETSKATTCKTGQNGSAPGSYVSDDANKSSTIECKKEEMVFLNPKGFSTIVATDDRRLVIRLSSPKKVLNKGDDTEFFSLDYKPHAKRISHVSSRFKDLDGDKIQEFVFELTAPVGIYHCKHFAGTLNFRCSAGSVELYIYVEGLPSTKLENRPGLFFDYKKVKSPKIQKDERLLFDWKNNDVVVLNPDQKILIRSPKYTIDLNPESWFVTIEPYKLPSKIFSHEKIKEIFNNVDWGNPWFPFGQAQKMGLALEIKPLKVLQPNYDAIVEAMRDLYTEEYLPIASVTFRNIGNDVGEVAQSEFGNVITRYAITKCLHLMAPIHRDNKIAGSGTQIILSDPIDCVMKDIKKCDDVAIELKKVKYDSYSNFVDWKLIEKPSYLTLEDVVHVLREDDKIQRFKFKNKSDDSTVSSIQPVIFYNGVSERRVWLDLKK